jgi:hypothetical protein
MMSSWTLATSEAQRMEIAERAARRLHHLEIVISVVCRGCQAVICTPEQTHGGLPTDHEVARLAAEHQCVPV